MRSHHRLALAAVAIFAVANGSPAHADSHFKKVVRDTNGHVVKNTFNNCVLTNWSSNADECAGQVAPDGLSLEDRTIYFGFNKSNLTPESVIKLERLSSIIKNSKRVVKANIYGYADKIGNAGYNQRLSLKRANNVKNYLAKQGLQTGVVDLRGFGEDRPVAKCDAIKQRKPLIDCLAPNRRVEIELEYQK